MKDIAESSASFEAWQRSQMELYEPDVRVKRRSRQEPELLQDSKILG